MMLLPVRRKANKLAFGPKRGRTTLVALVTGALIAATLPAAYGQNGDDSQDGLVGEWLFSNSSGSEVTNEVSGGQSAEVINADDDLWTGTALEFAGGSKGGSGNWVQLPANLLTEAESATISTEIILDESMKGAYHFLWNIGSDSESEYWFSSTRDNPRTTITSSGNPGEKNAQAQQALDAARWYQLTSVLVGAAGTLTFF